MKILVRNLSNEKEVSLFLPMEEEKLEETLGNGEWIFIEWSKELPLEELSSVREVNTFLQKCNEEGTSEDTLRILTSAGFLYEEIKEKTEKSNYTIVDFTFVTDGWNCGNGGDIYSDTDKGLALYKEGYALLPFEVTEEMEDYIDWSAVWRDADCSGWRTCRVGSISNFRDYLVL